MTHPFHAKNLRKVHVVKQDIMLCTRSYAPTCSQIHFALKIIVGNTSLILIR